jgi:hypothetical protein
MDLNIQNMHFKINILIRIFLLVLIIIMNTFYLQLYLTIYKLQLIIWEFFIIYSK